MSPPEVITDFAGYTRMTNRAGKVMRARLGVTLKLAKHYQTVIDVVNNARLKPVQANKAKPTHDLRGTGESSKRLFVAEPVLKCANNRMRADERRKQILKLIVGSSLQRDQ